MEKEKQMEFGRELKELCDKYKIALTPQVVINTAGVSATILMTDKKPEVIPDEKTAPEPVKPTTPAETSKA